MHRPGREHGLPVRLPATLPGRRHAVTGKPPRPQRGGAATSAYAACRRVSTTRKRLATNALSHRQAFAAGLAPVAW